MSEYEKDSLDKLNETPSEPSSSIKKQLAKRKRRHQHFSNN